MNILLVDDEAICISTVSHILNNMYDGETSIYTATSAAEALEIVNEVKIDLVFTDIRMPNTDGLELAKSILKLRPTCEIVILSAYDQKKYLKAAINLNVLRYLQKPVNPTEIIEVASLVATKHQTLQTMSVPDKIDMMQNKIIEILISKNYQSEKIRILADHILDSEFFSCKYYSSVLVMAENSDIGSEISDAVKSFMKSHKILALQTIKNAMTLYVFGSNNANLAELLKTVFEQGISEEHRNKIQICIGNTVNALEDISASYINSCILTEYSFYTKKGIHQFNEQTNYFSSDHSWNAVIFDADSVPCYEDGFLAYIKNIYNSLKQSASAPKKSVHILFFNIINHMVIQAKNNGMLCDVFMDDIYYLNFLTLEDLYQFSIEFVSKHSLYLPMNKMAFNIKNYIKQNYQDKHLSIDSIAAHFYMSPQYIPKLFKKAFGISITQYITNTRIATAKSLIKTQDMGIKNIAEAIGYEDANYFSRLFKKKTGMTFTEYKNQQNN